jgi:uncharacterized protein YcgI (DUF1989 family)
VTRTVVERLIVPAREGRALRIPAGRSLRVVDLEGQQVGDLFAFVDGDVAEYASAEHTRVGLSRLFPRVGESFLTNRRRPILTLVADDSPGLHDMLCAACDPTRYATLGWSGWHASCEENLRAAMASAGYPETDVPQPVNLFMHVPVASDGSLGFEPARTRPGDSVTLRAELPAIVVLSACPQDLVPINGPGPTSLAIELLASDADARSDPDTIDVGSHSLEARRA